MTSIETATEATPPEDGETELDPSTTQVDRLLSAAVHLLTASGAVLAVLALLSIQAGNLGRATLFILIALVIDSVDGTLARAVGVTVHLPQINGRRMDDIVDYLNFVIVPAVFMVQAGNVLHPAWVALPVLASAYGFSREDAKTDDDFFLGFPSYWNVLALYLWLLDITPLGGTIWVVCLSAAVFIPWKYVYPSKLANPALRYSTSYAGVPWAIAVGYAALQEPSASRTAIAWWSLLYPAFYMGLSAWLGGWKRG